MQKSSSSHTSPSSTAAGSFSSPRALLQASGLRPAGGTLSCFPGSPHGAPPACPPAGLGFAAAGELRQAPGESHSRASCGGVLVPPVAPALDDAGPALLVCAQLRSLHTSLLPLTLRSRRCTAGGALRLTALSSPASAPPRTGRGSGGSAGPPAAGLTPDLVSCPSTAAVRPPQRAGR